MTGPATIFALASGAGAAGVAVVRVSGPGAGAALAALTGRPLPRPRMAARRRLVDPATAETLDEALVLWMPGPASYTGDHPQAERAIHPPHAAAQQPRQSRRRSRQSRHVDGAGVQRKSPPRQPFQPLYDI